MTGGTNIVNTDCLHPNTLGLGGVSSDSGIVSRGSHAIVNGAGPGTDNNFTLSNHMCNFSLDTGFACDVNGSICGTGGVRCASSCRCCCHGVVSVVTRNGH